MADHERGLPLEIDTGLPLDGATGLPLNTSHPTSNTIEGYFQGQGHSPNDDSISVLDDPSTIGVSTGIDLPQFHIVTGPRNDVEEASHYALKLSCQSLQRKNRELEEQMQKLQKENQKIKRKTAKNSLEQSTIAMETRSSLSPPGSLRTRGPSDQMGPNSQLNGSLSVAQEEFVDYLQGQLQKSQMEKRDLSGKLDQERANNLKLEKKVRDKNQELDDALQIAAQRRQDLEELRQEKVALSLSLNQVKSQLELQLINISQSGNLTKKIKELEAKVAQLEAENSNLTQQLYEDIENGKREKQDRTMQEYKNKCLEFIINLKDKDKEINLLLQSKLELETNLRSLEALNQMYHNRLDKEGQYGREEELIGRGGSSLQSVTGAAGDRVDGISDHVLEMTRKQIVELKSQVEGMHDIIKKQTSLIKELGRKLRERSSGSLTGSSASGPGSADSGSHIPINLQDPGTGARPRVPGRRRSISPLRDRTIPESQPIVCAEDLLSFGGENEEYHTLVEFGSQLDDVHINQMDVSHGAASASSNLVFLNPAHTALDSQTASQAGNPRSGNPWVRGHDTLNINPQGPTVGRVVNSVSGAGHSSNTYAPMLNFQAQAIVRPNESHTEPIIRHPPPLTGVSGMTVGTNSRQSVTEPLNPLNTNRGGVSGPQRQLNIERNIGGSSTSTADPHHNRNQNINLEEMIRDKHPPSSSHTEPLLNTNPFMGNLKPVPTTNIYTDRTNRPVEQSDLSGAVNINQKSCPVCQKSFRLSQEAFEDHVNDCLSQTEAASPSGTPTNEVPVQPVAADLEMLECPVCSQVFPTGQDDALTEHVESHFVDDRFEVLAHENRR